MDENGMLKSGVVIRHLILPGHLDNSKKVIDYVAERFKPGEVLFSLMRQYTPDFAPKDAPKHLLRRVTTFEYNTVANLADSLGFEGFLQGGAAASAAYTPDFGEK